MSDFIICRTCWAGIVQNTDRAWRHEGYPGPAGFEPYPEHEAKPFPPGGETPVKPLGVFYS